jgi:uncharacterized coiled-coil DUF342 family protein
MLVLVNGCGSDSAAVNEYVQAHTELADTIESIGPPEKEAELENRVKAIEEKWAANHAKAEEMLRLWNKYPEMRDASNRLSEARQRRDRIRSTAYSYGVIAGQFAAAQARGERPPEGLRKTLNDWEKKWKELRFSEEQEKNALKRYPDLADALARLRARQPAANK